MVRLWEVGQAACPGRAAPVPYSRSLLQGPGACMHTAWHHATVRCQHTLHSSSSSSRPVLPRQHGHHAHPWSTPGVQPQPQPVRARGVACCASMASHDSNQPKDGVYPLQKTQVLVETAMLAAVGGLSYLLSTLLKLEGSLGYFLPLPIVLSAMRGGHTNGFKTMTATGFLIVVLLGPLKAISYILMHGLLAATLGSMWRQQANFWLCVLVGAGVRMCGQILYLLLSSVTMNENLFAIMLSNVYAMLDQAVWSVMGMQGSPAPVAIISVLCALTLVNALCYVFLLQIIYRIILQRDLCIVRHNILQQDIVPNAIGSCTRRGMIERNVLSGSFVATVCTVVMLSFSFVSGSIRMVYCQLNGPVLPVLHSFTH